MKGTILLEMENIYIKEITLYVGKRNWVILSCFGDVRVGEPKCAILEPVPGRKRDVTRGLE